MAQLQITVRDMPHSEALESRVRRKVMALERLFPRITSFHVTVQAPPQHQRQGGHFTVGLDIRLPAGEVVVNRDHAEDAHVALQEAFQAARRKLVEQARRAEGGARSRRSAWAR